MFDIGFLELLVIAIIALLVLGPERLPGAVRTASRRVTQLKRAFNHLKTELDKEINTTDLKQDAHNTAIMEQLKKSGNDLNDNLEQVRSELTNLEFDINNTSDNSSDSKQAPKSP